MFGGRAASLFKPRFFTAPAVRSKSDVSTTVIPEAPTTIALQDKDRIDLTKNKAPEELLEDVKTHTGQKWDKGDYRLVRFVNFPKLVNTRRAIDLIHEVPPTPVHGSRTFCDGGGGPLGHPKVYINVDKPGNHACGYCGLRFFKSEDHHH
ncbi:NADH dehydrogenase [ubiquinone] iron-sulfur protein 6, mitochondrial-like [Paramacrobiotus metropolitanus]|uniref:NADH dehydrogenase [ubiquinone] iron-sulfur protein 6, mitochondrial-like n=1 Tax=Paramacrobiotus metropolitanus TaxID=2943436 RepID=UPI002445A9C2|nr:NADH dehydrogenase [ubiquinone] iron-sulfur protein 6, mitochondrial-like [Paramacrobiotus metropolitanus]